MAIKDVPAIYMACGTDDSLIKENRDYRDFYFNRESMSLMKKDQVRMNGILGSLY